MGKREKRRMEAKKKKERSEPLDDELRKMDVEM
jgi:hypothetical protein